MNYVTHGAEVGPARHQRQGPRTAMTVAWGWALVATVAFAALAFTAHSTPYFPVDLTVTQAVQSLRAQWFDAAMLAVSWPGFPPQVFVWVGLLIVAFLVARRYRQAFFLVFATVGVGTISAGIKVLVNRPRPSPALVHVLDPSLNGGKWSFPAGHVESYVVILGFLFFLAYASSHASLGWRLARTLTMVITAVMILLIGVSRIYEGEHWFSDVVAGYLLGSVWLVVTIYFYKYWHRPQPAATPDRLTSPGLSSTRRRT